MNEENNENEDQKPEEEFNFELEAGEIVSTPHLIDMRINHSLGILKVLGDLPEAQQLHPRIKKMKDRAIDLLDSGMELLEGYSWVE